MLTKPEYEVFVKERPEQRQAIVFKKIMGAGSMELKEDRAHLFC